MRDLTAASIKEAQPGDILRDTLIKGLQMRVTKDRKVFYFNYRFRGVERRPKIGDYPALTVPQARELCRNILLDKSAGIDPLWKKSKFEHTVEALWQRYYRDRARHKKSADEDARIWERYLKARFSHRYVETITYDDVASLHAYMKDTPYQANRVLALLSTLFNFGVAPLKWMTDNPCKGVRRYKEAARKRYYSTDELRAICTALDAKAKDNPQSVALIYALIYTGARKSELAMAKREWLDGNVLRLPDSKTGAKEIIMPEPALKIIEGLPKRDRLFGVSDPKKLWDIVRKEAGCPDLRMHDLRHSFASMALAAGVGLSQIGELLGHSSTQTTKRYAHLVTEAAETAAAITAAKIATLLR